MITLGQFHPAVYTKSNVAVFDDNSWASFSNCLYKIICGVYTLEAPLLGASNEYPQYMFYLFVFCFLFLLFLWRNTKTYPRIIASLTRPLMWFLIIIILILRYLTRNSSD